MKSFLNKRRKSMSGPSPSKQLNEADLEAPPLPPFARQAGGNRGMLDAKSSTMEMPDLRFSKLDLDIDMSKFHGGPESRPGSLVQGEERRKSRMAFLGINNSKAGLSSDELHVPRLGMVPGRSSSATNLAEPAARTVSPPQSSSFNSNTMPRSKMLEQDRRKLVASATEAMNLDVPVKAPIKHQAARNAGPRSPEAGKEPATSPVLKSKKDMKKEEKEKATREKERAAREKERAKEAAKEAKESVKREKDLARRMSKADLKKEAATKPMEGVAKPVKSSGPVNASGPPKVGSVRPEQRRALDSKTNIHVAVAPSKAPSPGQGKPSTRGASPPDGGRPPGAPPSHKPPSAPISGSKKQQPTSKAATSTQRPSSRSSSGEKAAKEAQPAPGMPFQFPRPTPAAAPRSQSAIPAADGVPRPVVSRGQTQGGEKKTGQSGGSLFGGPITAPPSPLMKDGSAVRPFKSPSRSANQTATTVRSSSEEGGTSSTVGGPSSESNTSVEGPSPDSPRSNDAFEERFVDASQSFAPRPRPRRDEEREERAQSRLSAAFDVEMHRAMAGHDGQHERNESKDSTHRFSALLLASRPGGAADRSAEASGTPEPTAGKTTNPDSQRQHYLSNGKVYSARPAPPPPQPVKRVREVAPTPKRRVVVRPELVDEGTGWKCHGVGDVDGPNQHERLVTETVLRARVVEQKEDDDKEGTEGEEASADGETASAEGQEAKEPKVEYDEEEVQVRYSDLFELLWTTTTPDVLSRLISHLDITDLKALRQTSHSIRFILNVQDNREMVLNKYLSCIGYRTWTYVKGSTANYRTGARTVPTNATKDPCPLSFNDCEAFLISQDLLPEYAAVGKEFAAHPDQMDPRMARLARASTRAYSRVLTRLRLQPVFKIPSAARPSLKAEDSSVALDTAGESRTLGRLTKHNSYFRLAASPSSPTEPLPGSAIGPSASSLNVDTKVAATSEAAISPVETVSASASAAAMASPWKPGRAAFYRIWVPASDPSGWLSDEELTQCESELFKAGVWNFLKKGDVVWDTAVGESLNEGKYIFDGHYLRDLSYAHDVAGHLPSWLNCVLYSPSYWHNIIKCSTTRPVIYFDISPWKDQILNSLRLVQDQVESYSNTGSRYRVAKWLYRSAANVSSGQIISKMSGGLEVVDEGWNGRIVIETEGTAEHAKSLISRCAGPHASPQAKAELLASVMGDITAANKMMNTNDTNGLTRPFAASSPNPNAATVASEVQNSAWMIMRERSRPGLIWIKLTVDRA